MVCVCSAAAAAAIIAMLIMSFFDSLQQVPKELTRNLFLIRELHVKVAKLRWKIVERKAQLKVALNAGTADATFLRTKHDEIEALHKDIAGLCEEKVLLSNRCYELVDSKIRLLDADLARSEKDLKQSIQLSAQESMEAGPSGASASSSSKSKSGRASTPKHRRIDTQPTTPLSEALDDLSGVALIRHITGASEAVDDMPVDPHEPVYCVCRDVSYGMMVCCDAPSCPIEWYHFACVGLTKAPKGNWICPHCSKEPKK